MSIYRPLLFALALAIGTASPVHAQCGDGGQCHNEFVAAKAAAWTGSGFVVAGQVKSAVGTQLGVLRISPSGGPIGSVMTIPWPDDVEVAEDTIADPRKIISLSDGAYVVLSQIFKKQSDEPQLAWVVRIGANDKINWNQIVSETDVSVILHSGYFAPADDKLILVGRETIGPACDQWSQSLVVGLRASSGMKMPNNLIRGTRTREPTSRQAIWDIVSGDLPGSQIVTGVVSGAHQDARRKCQHDIFLARLTQAQGKWSLTPLGMPFGARDADEVAFSIRPAGPGTFVLAGQGPDPQTRATVAQAFRVKLNPLVPESPISTPLSEQSALAVRSNDSTYRVIARLTGSQRLLVAGARLKGGNQGFWHFLSPDLRATVQPPILINSPLGSDIYDAAPAPNGKVLLVGRWMIEENASVGWFRLLGDDATAPVLASSLPRRAPNDRLTPLSDLSVSNDIFQIKGDPVAEGAGFYGRDLAGGSQIKMDFQIKSPSQFKVTSLTASGDIDLLLSDRNGLPLAFSNNRGLAPELIAVALRPGSYTLSLLAQTKVSSFEVRFAPFQDVDMAVISRFSKLAPDQRIEIDRILIGAGYLPAGEPNIALGGETVRSLIAAQEGSARPIAPESISLAISDAFKPRQ